MGPSELSDPKDPSPIPFFVPLTRAVRVSELQELQDRFAALGRMTVVVCDVDAYPITTPTWGSRYSMMIGTSARGKTRFADAIRDCLELRNALEPLTCLEGMTLYAAPIIHESQHLAYLVIGTRAHGPPRPDVVRRIARDYQLPEVDLVREAALIDPFRGGTPDAIHRFADVQAHIIATLYAQAVRIERQLADLRIIHRLSDLLAGTLDLQEILDLTVRNVTDVMPVKACAIRLLNEDTGELVIKAVYNLSRDYVQKGPVFLRDNAIDATAFAGETVYIEDAPNDPRSRYPENARREGLVSGLCVPMTYRGQTVGVIRVYTGHRYVFSESEEALLRSLGAQAASAIINSRFHAERTRNEQIQRHVEAAGLLQRRMLPSRPPTLESMTLAAVYDPTLALGGDFYDFIRLDDGSVGLCVADVVGKGLPAAMMMASIRSSLRSVAVAGWNPAETIRLVNRQIARDLRDGEFATLFYGVLIEGGRALCYVDAGHPPPLLLRDDRFTPLFEGGLVLGIDVDEVYESATIRFQPEDILVAYSDGVTEAMNFSGEPYGLDRLKASILRHRALSTDSLAKQLLWDLRRFVGLVDQSDDITIVTARKK